MVIFKVESTSEHVKAFAGDISEHAELCEGITSEGNSIITILDASRGDSWLMAKVYVVD